MGKPFVHAQITIADETGRTCSGHLARGTIIFACEYIIYAFSGTEFTRKQDEETGLPLWDIR